MEKKARAPLTTASVEQLLTKNGYDPQSISLWKQTHLKASVGQFQGRVIFIDGLIGAGKSTLLTQFAMVLSQTINPKTNRLYKVIFVQEPVDLWRQVGILQRFYADPTTHAYAFQTYTFITRVQAILTAIRGTPDADLCLVERSVFTDRHVFMHLQRATVGESTMKMYLQWFNLYMDLLPFDVASSTFVYLRPTIDQCMHRVEIRARPEEQYKELQKNGETGATKAVANPLASDGWISWLISMVKCRFNKGSFSSVSPKPSVNKAAAGGVSADYQHLLMQAHDRLFFRGYLYHCLQSCLIQSTACCLTIYDYCLDTEQVISTTTPYDPIPVNLIGVVLVPSELANDDFTRPSSPGRNRLVHYLLRHTHLVD